MTRIARMSVVALALLIIALAAVQPAQSVTGDNLARFDAAQTAGIPPCGIGTGLAFDGNSLILSCWGSNVLERVDAADRTNNGALTISGLSNIGAMAYDGVRDRLWACSNYDTVVLIDMSTQALDPSHTPFTVPGCVDGLAYDAIDDTVWVSPDVSSITYHYSLSGTLLGSHSNAGMIGGAGNSGIAVGGEQLYLANNGGQQIYQISKDFSTSSLLATFPERLEDLECDAVTFAPKAVIWSQDAYDRIMNAWEIPAGLCRHGGGLIKCDDLTATITRPEDGRLYMDDADAGSSGSTTPAVRGTTLTVEVHTSDVSRTAAVSVYFDGQLQGTDTTAPYSVVTDVTASPGLHWITASIESNDPVPCVTKASQDVEVQCFDVQLAVLRPTGDEIYLDDVVVGTSDDGALALGGPLTARAQSSDVSRTSGVTLSVDGGAPLPMTGANPYEATVNTDALTPGAHELTFTLAEVNEHCTEIVTVPLSRPDPSLKGVAKGVYGAINVPAEPQVHAGGASVGKDGGSDFERVADYTAEPAVDEANVITDETVAGTISTGMTTTTTSVVTDVSLLDGAITADVLRAEAHATLPFDDIDSETSHKGSLIAGLRIGGIPVTVTQPNTVVPLPDGKGYAILYEVLESGETTRGEITVNMVHAFLDSSTLKGELIVASAHAGVNLSANLFTGPETDLIHRPDDAGTNADAGDTLGTATPVTPSIFSAALTPGDEQDWYSFPARQGERILAVVKPAERAVATVGRQPSLPSGPGDVPAFVTGTVGSLSVSTATPDVQISLVDPSGDERAVGPNLPGSAPERAEINADEPYAPGETGTWRLRVQRTSAADGFYTVELSVLPEPLLDQNDGGVPGDAPGECTAARAINPSATVPGEVDSYTYTGVIKDDDQRDFYTFSARQGQIVGAVMKPDELDDGADFDLYLYQPFADSESTDCSNPTSWSALGKEGIAKALPEVVGTLPAERSGRYVLEVRRYNAVANYTVTLTVANPLPTLPSNDALTGGDAGNACAAATPLSPGLYEGQVLDRPTDDREDWYRITVAPGQDLTAVMKPSELSNFDLRLYTPSCVEVPADQYTLNELPLSAPETVHVGNGTAGAYLLRVTKVSGGGNYLLGVAVTP